jgi:nitrate reductase NapE component
MFYKAIDKVVDKLPTWVKFILVALAVFLSVYCISKYGFWSFLLRVIFSP